MGWSSSTTDLPVEPARPKRAGTPETNETARSVALSCRDRIAYFKAPGWIYFIDSLLAKAREDQASGDLDWARIDQLRSLGGIRIEDNLLVTEDGAENLTRSAFATVA